MEETAIAPPRRGRPPKNPKVSAPLPDNGVMDLRTAARYLLISPDTLYKYASEGFVPAFKLGNRWRFRKAIIDNWMTEREAAESALHGND